MRLRHLLAVLLAGTSMALLAPTVARADVTICTPNLVWCNQFAGSVPDGHNFYGHSVAYNYNPNTLSANKWVGIEWTPGSIWVQNSCSLCHSVRVDAGPVGDTNLHDFLWASFDSDSNGNIIWASYQSGYFG